MVRWRWSEIEQFGYILDAGPQDCHRLNVGEDREGGSMKTLTFWLEQHSGWVLVKIEKTKFWGGRDYRYSVWK